MPRFNQEEFNQFVLEVDAIGFFEEPITLKSGRTSHWYTNWRPASSDAYQLNRLANYVLAFTANNGLEPDCFYGVPEGATKLAKILNMKLAIQSPNFGPGSHVVPMGRGAKKLHGDSKERDYLGEPRDKTIIIEDVTTTGNSLLESIADIRKMEKARIIATYGLTNRMEKRYKDGKSVEEVVRAEGVLYLAMSDALQVLPAAYELKQPGEKIGRIVDS